MTTHRLRRRLHLESLLSASFLVLFVVTAVSAEWVEALTGLDPDGGSGVLEWGLTAVLGLCAAASGLLAARDARRLRATTD